MYQQGRNTVTNNYSTTNKTVVNRHSPTTQNRTRSFSQVTDLGESGGVSAVPGMTYTRSDSPGQYQANPPPNGMMYSQANRPSPWDMYSQSTPAQQYGNVVYSPPRGGNQYQQNYDSAGNIRQLSSALNAGRGQTQGEQAGPNSQQRRTPNPRGTPTQDPARLALGRSVYGRPAGEGENNGPRYGRDPFHLGYDVINKRHISPKVWA